VIIRLTLKGQPVRAATAITLGPAASHLSQNLPEIPGCMVRVIPESAQAIDVSTLCRVAVLDRFGREHVNSAKKLSHVAS
jgi:hypothetical protein